MGGSEVRIPALHCNNDGRFVVTRIEQDLTIGLTNDSVSRNEASALSEVLDYTCTGVDRNSEVLVKCDENSINRRGKYKRIE